MSIPKQIYQTYKNDKFSCIVKYHIKRLKRMNPEYSYNFYDDTMVVEFLKDEFPVEYLQAYNRLTIGASKADFFRYAILYKRGGIYLDLDVKVIKPFREFVLPTDKAIISNEIDKNLFVQWALFFAPHHPFLEKTLKNVLININERRFPNDVHLTTGPTPYSNAIKDCLTDHQSIPYRLMGMYYDGKMKEKYKLAKIAIYGNKKYHWRSLQTKQDVVDKG